jgi:secondary thiamine-phosphate synthase enzyme
MKIIGRGAAMPRVLIVQTTRRSELVDITELVAQEVERAGLKQGLCALFVPHTTAAITLNENADPSVREDLLAFLERAVPWAGPYRHLEGNAAAHIKASLLGASVLIPVQGSRLQLGTWQGIYLAEFDGPRQRRVLLDLVAT